MGSRARADALPLYDGGLRYGQEHERKAVANEAQLDVEATLRQARSDVRAAFEEMQRADVALDQAQQSATFATQALALANLAYRAGATTNLEVIDAERQARDAETQAAIAEDAARQARLDLMAASGRFSVGDGSRPLHGSAITLDASTPFASGFFVVPGSPPHFIPAPPSACAAPPPPRPSCLLFARACTGACTRSGGANTALYVAESSNHAAAACFFSLFSPLVQAGR